MSSTQGLNQQLDYIATNYTHWDHEGRVSASSGIGYMLLRQIGSGTGVVPHSTDRDFQGDPAAADKLEKLVDADRATGDKSLLMGDDGVVKVALRLRARAMP